MTKIKWDNFLQGFPGGSEGNGSAYNAGYLGSIPGSGRSSGEGKGNPLQYSCLENPMDRGAWQATVHGIPRSPTWLTNTQRAKSYCCPVAQLCLTLWDSMDCSTPGPPCPSPSPGAYPNSCPLSRWCHPTISSSVVSFSSCPQSFPASGSFQMSQLFASDCQSIGVSASASVLPMPIHSWFPLGLTGLVSLESKRLSRVLSNTTVQKHQFFNTHLSLWSNSHTHT